MGNVGVGESFYFRDILSLAELKFTFMPILYLGGDGRGIFILKLPVQRFSAHISREQELPSAE